MILSVFKKFLPFFLIFLLASILFYETAADTPTYDEPANMAAAFAYVYKNDFRLYPDNPPLVKLLSGLTLFPMHKNINFPQSLDSYKNPAKFDLYAFGAEFLYRSNNNPKLIARLTRLPNIFITIALGILLYHFAKKLYGEKAGILALFLYALDPNIRGHGHILAFDLPLALVAVCVFYLTFLYLKFPKKRRFWGLLISLVFAAGFLTKFTMVFIALIYFLGLVFIVKKSPRLSFQNLIFLLLSIAIVSFSTLWIFGSVTNYNKRTLDYDKVPIIESANRKLSLDVIWNIAKILPVPYFYKTGIQVMYTHNIVSQPAFLLGSVHAKNDWFFYFPISFLLKTPIPSLIFIFLSIFLLLKTTWQAKKRHGKNPPNLQNYFPFFTGFAFMFLMMISSHINNTYRYLFPSLVFFIIGASQLVNLIDFKKQRNLAIGAILVLYLILTSLFSFPYDLSYTNELTGIPPVGYKYLSDSEVDWGQDLERLSKWLKDNKLDEETITLSYLGTADPAYFGIKYKPLKFEELDKLSGIIAISVANLTLGDWQWTSQPEYKIGLVSAPLDFLRKRKPLAIIGKSIFIYRL